MEDGALGRLGGSGQVYSEAINQCMWLRHGNPQGLIQMCRDILGSPNQLLSAGRHGGVGQTLAAQLLMDGDLFLAGGPEAVSLTMDILDHSHWGGGAARQLIAYRTSTDAPRGLDVTAWSQLWFHAQTIANR